MKSVYVKFNNKDDIGNFVNIVNNYDGDFDLVKGRKMIDAKSYLGILCFELTAPLRLDIYSENDSLMQDISSYIVNV